MGVCYYRFPVFTLHEKWRVLKRHLELLALSCCFIFCGQSSKGVESGFISSGTIVVIDFEDDRILVAADSRQAGAGVSPESIDRGCKIIPLGEKMFFTASARSGAIDENGTMYIDINKAAITAFDQFRTRKNTSLRARQIAAEWGDIARSEYEEMFRRDPGGFFRELRNGNLAAAAFAGSTDTNELVIYAVFVTYYFRPEGAMPRTVLKPEIHIDILPWKRLPGSSEPAVWINGSRDRIGVTEFVEAKTERAITANIALQGAIQSTPHADVGALTLEHAIKAAIEWATYKEEVGGDVDILELPRIGHLRWIKAKQECKE